MTAWLAAAFAAFAALCAAVAVVCGFVLLRVKVLMRVLRVRPDEVVLVTLLDEAGEHAERLAAELNQIGLGGRALVFADGRQIAVTVIEHDPTLSSQPPNP